MDECGFCFARRRSGGARRAPPACASRGSGARHTKKTQARVASPAGVPGARRNETKGEKKKKKKTKTKKRSRDDGSRLGRLVRLLLLLDRRFDLGDLRLELGLSREMAVCHKSVPCSSTSGVRRLNHEGVTVVVTLRYVTVRYVTLLQYSTVQYSTVQCIKMTLYYITLHYITLHYITLHFSILY